MLLRCAQEELGETLENNLCHVGSVGGDGIKVEGEESRRNRADEETGAITPGRQR